MKFRGSASSSTTLFGSRPRTPGKGLSRAFDLVIFDFDGTLADSQALLVDQVVKTLAAANLAIPAEAAIARTIGLPLEKVFRRAQPNADKELVEKLCREYREEANRMDFVSRFQLFPSVLNVLSGLEEIGAEMIIATSKSRPTTIDILDHCEIHDFFNAVIGGDSVSQGKPHPEMVERACAIAEVSPSRALMVGDTSFDMEMGKAAGVSTCAAAYGMHDRKSLEELHPDYLIDSIEQLPSIIQSL